MNSLELKAERIRRGYTCDDMGKLLGLKSGDTYRKKEKGVTMFSPEQIAKIAVEFELPPDRTSLIFFDGKLPIGQSE